MILIVGASDDPHILKVADHLERSSKDYQLFDPYSISSAQLTINVSRSILLTASIGNIASGDISAVWWRLKPHNVIPTDSIDRLYDYYFCQREWSQFLDYLETEYKNAFWMNTRSASRFASVKARQLQAAENCGFKIPRTLVTNNFERVCSFIDELSPTEVVFKTQTAYMNPNGTVAFTRAISKSDVETFKQSIRKCPAIFQEFIEKDFELRVTIVGNTIFAARIDSTEREETKVDWRKGIFSDMYSRIELSQALADRLLLLHEKLGLTYGAYDLIQGVDGQITFLEVNPSGQWLWLEESLGLEISTCIASTLLENGLALRSSGKEQTRAVI